MQASALREMMIPFRAHHQPEPISPGKDAPERPVEIDPERPVPVPPDDTPPLVPEPPPPSPVDVPQPGLPDHIVTRSEQSVQH